MVNNPEYDNPDFKVKMLGTCHITVLKGLGKSTKPKIYISGKVTGMEELAFVLFGLTETMLIKKGFNVVNPMRLPADHGKTWDDYMEVCLEALKDCQVIYMMSNYEQSTGALVELAFAKELGLKIYFE